MNPFRWSYRVSFLAGFLICAGLLGFALFSEYHWNLIPCPLCIFQRVAFLVMAVFFLLGGLHAPRSGVRWVYTGGALLGAIFGIAVAGRHLWIQSLHGSADQVPSCWVPPLDYMFSAHFRSPGCCTWCSAPDPANAPRSNRSLACRCRRGPCCGSFCWVYWRSLPRDAGSIDVNVSASTKAVPR